MGQWGTKINYPNIHTFHTTNEEVLFQASFGPKISVTYNWTSGSGGFPILGMFRRILDLNWDVHFQEVLISGPNHLP